MGSYVRAAAITAAISVPLAVTYNRQVATDTDPFNEIPAAFIDISAGGIAAAGLVGSGVAALNPQWRGAAASVAGAGTGLALAAVLGFAALSLTRNGSD